MHSPQATGNTPLASLLLPAGIGGGSNGEGNSRKDDLLNHCVDTTAATATTPSAMATPNLCIIQVTGTSDYDLIRKFLARNQQLKGEMLVPRSNPPVRSRINAVNAYLRNGRGDQRLSVSGKCRELIKDLEEVCYKPDSGQIDKGRDSHRTHLSDALGYLLWQRSNTLGRVGERGDRLV